MPRSNINYVNCIIYKIVCNDYNIKDSYVGSTTEFTKRKYRHKSNCTSLKYTEHEFKVYQFIRNNGGWDNWSMIEIEKYPCNDGNEARARERYWCETLNATLNDRMPLKIKVLKPKKNTLDYSKDVCVYKYPESYKNCRVYSMEEIIEQNREYSKLISDKLKS